METVRKGNPTKQGLKHNTVVPVVDLGLGPKRKSNKTRIETNICMVISQKSSGPKRKSNKTRIETGVFNLFTSPLAKSEKEIQQNKD